jgi:hypothetical protein
MNGPCAIDDCGLPVATRGWCKMHYTRWQRHGDPLVTSTPYRGSGLVSCRIDGCGKRVAGMGLCAMHYKRLRVYGDPLAHPRPPARIDCSFDGCNKSGKIVQGLCEMHYARLLRWGNPAFTSYPHQGDPDARFLMYVTIVPTGCHLWTGMLNREGYAQFSVNNYTQPAHRWIWKRDRGPIPKGLMTDHLCHTRDRTCRGGPSCIHRRCVNLDHLELVTATENRRRSHQWMDGNRRA